MAKHVMAGCAVLGELLLQMKHGGFVLVDTHQQPGLEAANLAAEFRANRTGGPGDQHHAAANLLLHFLHVEIDRHAAQQIRERDVARLAQRRSPGNQFGDRRHGAERDPGLFAPFDQPPHLLRSRGGDGNQNFVDCEPAHEGGKILHRTEDRHAQHAQSLLERTVVDASDHLVSGIDLLGFADDHLRGMTGAHQKQPFGRLMQAHAFRQQARQHAHSTQQREGEHRLRA